MDESFGSETRLNLEIFDTLLEAKRLNAGEGNTTRFDPKSHWVPPERVPSVIGFRQIPRLQAQQS